MSQFHAIVVPEKSQASNGGEMPSLASLSHTLTPEDLLKAVKSISDRRLVEQVGTIYKFIVPDDATAVYYMDLKNGEFCSQLCQGSFS